MSSSLRMDQAAAPGAGTNAPPVARASAPTIRGDVAAIAQSDRLEQGAQSLGNTRKFGHARHDPVVRQSRKPEGTKETNAASETVKQAVGLGLETIGQAYHSSGSKFSKVATRTYLGRAAHAIGGLSPDSTGGRTFNRLGDWAAKSAEKIKKGWGFTSHIANYGASLAMRGMGAVVSAGADIVQNGVPQHARDVGALVAKNAITGAAAVVGGIVGSGAGPVGTVAGAVAAGQLMDGAAGNIADRLFGTNRYAPPTPAPAALPSL